MKWMNKYYEFENSILGRLNTYSPKYTSFDLSNGNFEYESKKVTHLDIEVFDLFGEMWFLNYSGGNTLFADIEYLDLKCEIMDYIEENYELS